MAEGNADGEPMEQVKARRRFCELFHGRFNSEEATLLLQHHEWDVIQAVNYAFNSTPEDISRFLQELDDGEWIEVRPRVNRRRRREEALQNENIRRLAAQNIVPAEVRQFACEGCNNMWWRKVPTRKMVSRCKRCRRRYDALPRDLEWGWAKFVCPCGFVFHGFGAMGRTLCLCYRCNQPVWPDSIIPPFHRRERVRGGRRRDDHSCLAPNCFRRTPPNYIDPAMIDPVLLQDLICVHPRSLGHATVVEESEAHRSTGSTVDTFLTQDDLDTHDPLGAYIPRVSPINEEGGADGNNEDNQ